MISFDINKIKLRFKRLILPYFYWNIISFSLNNIYYYLLKRECSHTFFDFLQGLLSGRKFIIALWFQNVLIFTTLISIIVVLLFKNDYILIFQILMIISYKFQYSGENYTFFNTHYKHFYAYTYGRFIDTFPNSITGFIIASLKIKNKIYYYKISLFYIFFVSSIF